MGHLASKSSSGSKHFFLEPTGVAGISTRSHRGSTPHSAATAGHLSLRGHAPFPLRVTRDPGRTLGPRPAQTAELMKAACVERVDAPLAQAASPAAPVGSNR